MRFVRVSLFAHTNTNMSASAAAAEILSDFMPAIAAAASGSHGRTGQAKRRRRRRGRCDRLRFNLCPPSERAQNCYLFRAAAGPNLARRWALALGRVNLLAAAQRPHQLRRPNRKRPNPAQVSGDKDNCAVPVPQVACRLAAKRALRAPAQ